MKVETTILIGALIAVIVAAIAWAATRREGFDNWDSLNIPGGEVKFADRSGGCSAGFTKITDGMRKGMCAPDKYIQGKSSAGPAPSPRPAPTPVPRPAPPKAQPPVRKQNWLEKLSESQDPLSAGKGGANAKPVEYNQGSNRPRPNITIASSGSKFRPKQGDGKCPAGYSEIMSGSRKGMCIKSEYARGGTPSGPSRMSGSKFSSKVNGQCPNGFSEITAGSRKGMCIKWEYAGKPSGSGGSSRPSGSSGSKFTSKIDGRCPPGTSEITAGGRKGQCFIGGSSSGGSGNTGSKFVGKSNGKCPSGTTEITAGSRKGQCIKNAAKENIEYNKKNVGSIYKARESASCPKGMTLVKSGPKKGMCIDEGKVLTRDGYRYWGWGPNAGLRCKNPDNTGCETKWVGGKLVDTKKQPKKPDFYWGWGPHAGMKCKNPNNTGCDTTFGRGSAPKPAPKPTPNYTPLSKPSDFKYPGKGKTEGLMCKNPDGTVCDASSRYNKNPWPYWGWGVHAGMKCKNSNNTGCSFDYAKK